MAITGTPIASSPGATEGYSFEELYKRVSEHIYQSYAPTGSQVAEVKRITNDGYKVFLSERRWTFLFIQTTLSVVADSETTALPSTLGSIEGDFHYAADQTRLFARQAPYGTIRTLISANQGLSEEPRLFSLEAVTFTAATGMRHQVRWWPVPNANETLTYQYEVRHPDMTSDAEFPIGGLVHSPAILAACLKAAEWRKGRQRGPMHDDYGIELAKSIKRDSEMQPANYGYMGDGSNLLHNVDRIPGTKTYNA